MKRYTPDTLSGNLFDDVPKDSKGDKISGAKTTDASGSGELEIISNPAADKRGNRRKRYSSFYEVDPQEDGV